MSDYHSLPQISRSNLMTFYRSRRLYYATYIKKSVPPQEETSAMQLGTLTHVAVLEPGKLESMIAIIPDHLLSGQNKAIASNEAKAWKKAAEEDGKIVLKDHEEKSTIAPIRGMRDAILNSHAGHWFSRPDAIAEKPIVWQDSETGLWLRALPDFRLQLADQHVATDIKTCADLRKFPKAVGESYWMQHVHYEAALQSVADLPVTFTFLAVEKTAPYLVNCYEMDALMVQRARAKWRETLRDLAECYASGNWSDPDEDEVIPISREIW